MSSTDESSAPVRESSSSNLMIEYYLRYAKNRDLKKYMRLSNSSCAIKTSSDDDEFLIKIETLNQVKSTPQGEEGQTPPAGEGAPEQTPTKDPIGQAASTAPDSSSKYARRLEWDSLGDVGYKKSCSTGNLSTLERSVLKELCTESPSEPCIQKLSSESSTPAAALLTTKGRKERWRATLETLGKKYSSTSTSLDTQGFSEQPQSTPKLIPSKEQSCQTSFSTRQTTPSNSTLISSTTSSSGKIPGQRGRHDPLGVVQSCQTSLIVKNSDKICQTSFETVSARPIPNVDELCQTSFDTISTKPVKNAEKLCQTSFEGIPEQRTIQSRITDKPCQTNFDRLPRQPRDWEARPEQKAENRQKSEIIPAMKPSTSKRESEELREKHHARQKYRAAQDNLSSRANSFATQSSFEYQPGRQSQKSSVTSRSILSEVNSNATCKTKASSDSDKENRIAKKQTRNGSDIDLGIQLLCSLIESQSLSGSRKKKLAKKIFEKIMKQQWDSPSSASIPSRSSTISSSPLIETSSPGRDKAVPVRETIQHICEQTQTDGTKSSEVFSATTPTPSPEPVTMREWLHPLTRSEKEYDKQLQKKSPQPVSPQTIERQKQLSWIDKEINRLEGLKNLLIDDRSSKSPSNQSKAIGKSSTTTQSSITPAAEETETINDKGGYRHTTRFTRNVVIYDEPAASDRKMTEKVEYKTTEILVNGEECASTSDYRKNRRSKLETPTTSSSQQECQSVSAFADQLQKQFMDNYLKKERERCASGHYSEPRVCGKQVFTRNPSYTSVASSAFCMSSEMSIPIVDSSSSSTTTHQYESHQRESVPGVAVQTTCSIIRTDPIFGPRCKCYCSCGRQCKCSCPKPTIRVSGQAFHQTVQVKPKAVAYVIRFKDSPTDTDGGTASAGETLTLQQQLERQHPDFYTKANRRREILQKLHELRQERDRQIREIAESSNNSSISRKLEELPPPPIKQVRVCATKEMKSLTRKRYCKLPEVVEKKEREKLERRKKTTRLITHIFNKKLQRMVHNGKLSLEYSRTVI